MKSQKQHFGHRICITLDKQKRDRIALQAKRMFPPASLVAYSMRSSVILPCHPVLAISLAVLTVLFSFFVHLFYVLSGYRLQLRVRIV